MNYNKKFEEDLVAALETYFKEIEVREIQKNNGVVLHGLILEKVKEVSPVYYVEDFLKSEYDKNYLEETAGKIYRSFQIEKKNNDLWETIQNLNDFEMFRDKVIIALINTEMNQNKLSMVPHREYFDLSIIYKIQLFSGTDFLGSANITNQMMESWQIEEDELYKIAMENTAKLLGFQYQKIGEILKEYTEQYEQYEEDIDDVDMKELCQNSGLVILTNKIKVWGAGVILFPDFIKKVMCEFGLKKAFIFPASVHEVILALGDENDIYGMKYLVREINDTKVEKTEILSYSVYEAELKGIDLEIKRY